MYKTIEAAIAGELAKFGWKPEDKFYSILRARLITINEKFSKKGRAWNWQNGESWQEYALDLYRLFGPEL